MKSYGLNRLLLVFCMAVFPSFAVGQTEPDNASVRCNVLGEIVVTATRYETETFETAVPTSRMDRKEIEDLAPGSMGALLRKSPGVYTAEDGVLSTARPVIRGFHGNQVLVMVDGQRLQSSLGGIWGGAELALVDPDQLERVEVVYGPSSSLYGSDALGGILNLITRRARLSETGYNSGSLNSYYETNGKGNRENLRIETGGKHAAFGVSLTNRQKNEYHTPDEKMQGSGFHMRSGALDATYSPLENHTFFLTVQVNRNRDLTRPPSVSPTAITEIETTKYNRTKVGLGYEWRDISDLLTRLKLNTYYHKDNSKFNFNGDIHPVPALQILSASSGDSELETFGAQGQLELSASRLYSVIGFDYYYSCYGPNETKARSQTRFLFLATPEEYSVRISEDGRADSLGLFVQNEITLSSRTMVSLGLRYDWYRSRITPHGDDTGTDDKRSSSDKALTGSLSISHAFFHWLRGYANVSTGFRAPSLRDLFYYGPVPGGLMSVGNPSLDSETSITYNLGFKVRSSRVQGAFTIFRSDVDDLIVSMTQQRVVTKENLGEARLWGGELWFDVRLNPEFLYSFSFSYTQGKDMTNRWPLQAVPPARLSQVIRWENKGACFGGFRVWAELECSYRFHQNRVARDWDQERMKTPGHAVWDLRCGIPLPKCRGIEKSEIYFALTNITDKRYTEFPLYDGYDLLTLPGIGATFGLKLNF